MQNYYWGKPLLLQFGRIDLYNFMIAKKIYHDFKKSKRKEQSKYILQTKMPATIPVAGIYFSIILIHYGCNSIHFHHFFFEKCPCCILHFFCFCFGGRNVYRRSWVIFRNQLYHPCIFLTFD